MNLQQVKTALNKLELPKQDYVVFGSAPMLAHNLISSINDIDLVARNAAWEKAQNLGSAKLAAADDKVICLQNKIDIYNGWMGRDLEAIFKRADYLDGLLYASLRDVLNYKLELNREKDQAHIYLLKQFLNQ